VEHLIFLFNLLTLFVGLVVAGVLFRTWRSDRKGLSFWQFLHFSGFTVTMVAAALDAYWVVNLGVGAELTQFWSSFVLVGTAVMLFAFPHLSRAMVDRPLPRRFTLFWGAWALVPLAGALLLANIRDYSFLMVVIFASFAPFWAAILYGMIISSRPKDRTTWEGWIVLAILLATAAAEILWILKHPPLGGYFFVTLPLAYLYTVWNTWRTRPRPVATPTVTALEVPEALAAELGLTPREREMADGILRGRSNKELAFELGLSENTVRNHISNLYRKLGIQKRLDLVLLVQKYQAN